MGNGGNGGNSRDTSCPLLALLVLPENAGEEAEAENAGEAAENDHRPRVEVAELSERGHVALVWVWAAWGCCGEIVCTGEIVCAGEMVC